jgi:hypothetical protein
MFSCRIKHESSVKSDTSIECGGGSTVNLFESTYNFKTTHIGKPLETYIVGLFAYTNIRHIPVSKYSTYSNIENGAI